jgi:hypothetical protein
LLTPLPFETRRAKIMAKASALMGEARAARVAQQVEEQADPSGLARELAG